MADVITLTEEDFEAFLARLESPREPTPAMVELFRRHGFHRVPADLRTRLEAAEADLLGIASIVHHELDGERDKAPVAPRVKALADECAKQRARAHAAEARVAELERERDEYRARLADIARAALGPGECGLPLGVSPGSADPIECARDYGHSGPCSSDRTRYETGTHTSGEETDHE